MFSSKVKVTKGRGNCSISAHYSAILSRNWIFVANINIKYTLNFFFLLLDVNPYEQMMLMIIVKLLFCDSILNKFFAAMCFFLGRWKLLKLGDTTVLNKQKVFTLKVRWVKTVVCLDTTVLYQKECSFLSMWLC